ncbi:hypothetical protein GJ744_007125 [Endocarpon pusillum]|uniref:Uncharacterized protein n=1 Tax=Endocarpon pusillum TaxID=364733 RepID=A0A8H7AN50_9EURO|nr:hypothetical protein GJ744_007125 [Endocarpon pusillum]
MKLQTLIIIPLLALASATPFPNSDNPASSLEPRDKWCRVTRTQTCYEHEWSTSRAIREIDPGDRFGVDCVMKGSWDWIPGWRCYVSTRYTASTVAGDTCEIKSS